MTGLEHFARLKQAVLVRYRIHYPYFTGDWKTFSSHDIQNLIALIENDVRETVSEKWIYTHLKPQRNDKLPRKDMLDIFSRFCGFSGWDEFAFEEEITAPMKEPAGKIPLYMAVGVVLIVAAVFIFSHDGNRPHKIKVTDRYTGKPVEAAEVEVYESDSSGPIRVNNGAVMLTSGPKNVIVKSPFYAPQRVTIDQSADSTEITLKPDDYAMMLKAFMKSDIKDWQARKVQLNEILSDDLEVMIMLKDDLGAESLNKDEFAQKLIIPTPSLRKLKIIEIKHGTDRKIQFIRLTQQ